MCRWRAPDIWSAAQSVRFVAAADERSHRRHDSASSSRPIEERHPDADRLASGDVVIWFGADASMPLLEGGWSIILANRDRLWVTLDS